MLYKIAQQEYHHCTLLYAFTFPARLALVHGTRHHEVSHLHTLTVQMADDSASRNAIDAALVGGEKRNVLNRHMHVRTRKHMYAYTCPLFDYVVTVQCVALCRGSSCTPAS
jgi:hypothetical protein